MDILRPIAGPISVDGKITAKPALEITIEDMPVVVVQNYDRFIEKIATGAVVEWVALNDGERSVEELEHAFRWFGGKSFDWWKEKSHNKIDISPLTANVILKKSKKFDNPRYDQTPRAVRARKFVSADARNLIPPPVPQSTVFYNLSSNPEK